ncbi:MAG: hypothetical protein A2Y79_03085 [Deltaproteobacteria bacterium RBG_13_43_22]|nr:MAG: hypothetical protein A2Y79_03085 [Deltaproteobacteria bacterium RBG_13_43_22]
MNIERLILERLENIETQIAPLAQNAKGIKELKDDLKPMGNQAVQLMIKELEEVESAFQLEDLMVLIKRLLRSVKNITYVLGQLENIIDFVNTLEPLLKSAVPQMINYLDEMERKGIFRIIQATLDLRAKFAQAFSPEEIDRIGDSMVSLLKLTEKMADPQALAFLEKMAEVPANVDLTRSKKVGPIGLLRACSSSEVKQGLGVLMELTKGIGKIKNNGHKVNKSANLSF